MDINNQIQPVPIMCIGEDFEWKYKDQVLRAKVVDYCFHGYKNKNIHQSIRISYNEIKEEDKNKIWLSLMGLTKPPYNKVKIPIKRNIMYPKRYVTTYRLYDVFDFNITVDNLNDVQYKIQTFENDTPTDRWWNINYIHRTSIDIENKINKFKLTQLLRIATYGLKEPIIIDEEELLACQRIDGLWNAIVNQDIDIEDISELTYNINEKSEEGKIAFIKSYPTSY